MVGDELFKDVAGDFQLAFDLDRGIADVGLVDRNEGNGLDKNEQS